MQGLSTILPALNYVRDFTVLEGRRSPIKRRQFVANNEHGNFRAVSALEPDLLGFEVIRIQSVHLGCPQNSPPLTLRSRKVIARNRARCIESGHSDEKVRLFLSIGDRCRADKVVC
jgi:hypothetical protein